jgi:methionyl-tRNA synthetase
VWKCPSGSGVHVSAPLQGDDAQKEEAAAALVAVLEAVRVVSVIMCPVTPGLSSRIYAGLGMTPEQYEGLRWSDVQWGGLPKGQAMPKPQPVFARLEGDFVTEPAPGKVAVAA